MNRKSDVDTILAVATQQHKMIRQDYEKALQDRSLDLRVPVKNLLENLRSALDYMAHDVYEICCQPTRTASGQPNPKNVYFPYGNTQADFRAGLGSSLPGLEANAPDVYTVLLSIQPFTCGDTWLCDLCRILNEKKHDRLKAQERSERETYTVEGQQGGMRGSITIPVNDPNFKVTTDPRVRIEIMGVPAEFREDGIYTAPSNDLKHRRTKWVAFTFEDTNVNVIDLLDKAMAGIDKFAKELYQKI